MDKKEAAQVLEEIAFLLELAGENPFKVRAYTSGARTILTLPGDLEEAVRTGALDQVKGIGKSLSGVIKELVETGAARIHEELKSKIPPGLQELLQVPGLGPKKARLLFENLQIDSLGELEYAIQENRLLSLPGFGAKTQERLKKGLEQMRRYAGLFRLGDLLPQAGELLAGVRALPGVLRGELAGGVRRGLEVDRGIEIVAAAGDPAQFWSALTSLSVVREFTMENGVHGRGLLPRGIPFTLTLAPAENFAGVWLALTGSEAHLQELQERARSLGWQITAAGLSQGGELIKGVEEDDIYRRLGLSWIPPELREGLGEIAAAGEGRLPRLVDQGDLRGCFHVHSYFSDGVNSLEELAAEVKSRGWEFLGISDHSQSAYYAGGLKPGDLQRQQEELSSCRRKYPRVTLFWGVESDILGDGSLDYPGEILQGFDFVIASIHSQFRLPQEEMTQRILQAMANPYCTMLGHVTGRLLLARDPYELNLEPILEFAARHQVIMELNASPFRLDLDWRWLKKAKEMGIMISLNPDAHSLEGFDDLTYGVMAARKGWLEPQDVLNTYPVAEVARLLKRRRDAMH
jgi:DNA polymerase (family 10)